MEFEKVEVSAWCVCAAAWNDVCVRLIHMEDWDTSVSSGPSLITACSLSGERWRVNKWRLKADFTFTTTLLNNQLKIAFKLLGVNINNKCCMEIFQEVSRWCSVLRGDPPPACLSLQLQIETRIRWFLSILYTLIIFKSFLACVWRYIIECLALFIVETSLWQVTLEMGTIRAMAGSWRDEAVPTPHSGMTVFPFYFLGPYPETQTQWENMSLNSSSIIFSWTPLFIWTLQFTLKAPVSKCCLWVDPSSRVGPGCCCWDR